MFDRVLVVAAGDDPNQPAVGRASQCVAVGGEIDVLDVVYEPMLEGYLGNTEIYEPLRRRVLVERQERVDALVRAVDSTGVRASGTAVWAHPLRRAVAERIAARGGDLVVVAVGTPGASGLSHSLWQLVLDCPVPVLVVKSDGRNGYRRLVAAVDPFHAHAKPAALDDQILRCAQALQARSGGTLTVLHCHTPLEYFGADLRELPPHDSRFVDGRQAALQALCVDAGVPVSAARLVAGAPHAVLQSWQAGGEADLTVMGALARGRFKELLLGSTAERLLHHGTGDVLVVKPRAA